MLKTLPLAQQIGIFENLSWEQIQVLMTEHIPHQQEIVQQWKKGSITLDQLKAMWLEVPIEMPIDKYAKEELTVIEDLQLLEYVLSKMELKVNPRLSKSFKDSSKLEVVKAFCKIIYKLHHTHQFRTVIPKKSTSKTHEEWVGILFSAQDSVCPEVSDEDLLNVTSEKEKPEIDGINVLPEPEPEPDLYEEVKSQLDVSEIEKENEKVSEDELDEIAANVF